MKCDHRSKFSNWKVEAWKKIRASTGFEPMTSAIPVRCSTNWAMKPHIGSKVNLLSSFLPVQWTHVKYIWNNSYLYCGMRWKWRVIAVQIWIISYILSISRILTEINANNLSNDFPTNNWTLPWNKVARIELTLENLYLLTRVPAFSIFWSF